MAKPKKAVKKDNRVLFIFKFVLIILACVVILGGIVLRILHYFTVHHK